MLLGEVNRRDALLQLERLARFDQDGAAEATFGQLGLIALVDVDRLDEFGGEFAEVAGAGAECWPSPLISTRLRSCSTPRIEIWLPSPNSRLSCTPVTRARLSPIFLSGKLAMSSATIESTTVPALRLRWIADCSEARVPTTTMSPGAFSSRSCLGASGWACAVVGAKP
jgi:hypothetical protein